jgi:hypothetical protein
MLPDALVSFIIYKTPQQGDGYNDGSQPPLMMMAAVLSALSTFFSFLAAASGI